MATSTEAMRDGERPVDQLLPPGQHFQPDHKAPAYDDGSFLYGATSPVYTPMDEQTGVTYPIVSERPLPAVGNSQDAAGRIVADWNHAYHPREQLTRGNRVELGLRNCRVEWVHRDDHNAYHRQFVGPDIDSFEDLMTPILFATAGYVPDKGLRYDGRDEAEIVHLPIEYRMQLWQSGRIKVVNTITVRDALLEEVLGRDWGGIAEQDIDEFLHTESQRRRFILGSMMLGIAVHDVTSPLRPLYRQTRERQHLPPTAAKTIGKFAMELIDKTNRTRAFQALHQRLLLAA